MRVATQSVRDSLARILFVEVKGFTPGPAIFRSSSIPSRCVSYRMFREDRGMGISGIPQVLLTQRWKQAVCGLYATA